MNLFLNNKDTIDFNEHYDQWIFDLDNTIYDFNLGLFTKVSSRMTEYIKDFFDLNEVDALTLQRNMYKKYGLTLRGLMIEKKIDPEPFLEFVHDVDFSELDEDITLKTLLGKIKGKKSIYTNATFKHAKNILKSMGIFEEFEIIFDIKDAEYIPKPEELPYKKVVNKFKIIPHNAVMIDDITGNLVTAKKLGFGTILVSKKESHLKNHLIDYSFKDIASIIKKINNKDIFNEN